MQTSSLLASQSYGTVIDQLKGPARPAEAAKPDFFTEYAMETAQTMRRGEETAKAALVGKADAHSVVAALSQTELAVQTAVAVRDKIVEAYQEILRMPV